MTTWPSEDSITHFVDIPEQMNEDPSAKQSWVAEGNLQKMLDTFSEFPQWMTSTFK